MAENGTVHAPIKSSWMRPLLIFFKDARLAFKIDSLTKEILVIGIPAAIAVAADPLASLIDTAFIGHLGPVQLAATGASIALFNQALRITVFPLVSITTSFVAEEDTKEKINALAAEKKLAEIIKADELEKGVTKENNNETPKESLAVNGEIKVLVDGTSKNVTNKGNAGKKKRRLASASTALLFGLLLGLFQAAILILLEKPLLYAMGLKHNSPMLVPAGKYLRLRALGSPAVLLSMVMQGIFRGFKDATTPLYVILSGYALNVALDPILIFYCKLGIEGAAISHVLAQYVMALALLLILMKKMVLLPPGLKDLQIFRFLKNGGLVLARVVAVTFCITLSASLASRLGPIKMAGFQVCLQVWLTSSLLADGLAVAVQAILACSFTEKNNEKVAAAAARTLQLGFILGVILFIFVGAGLYFGAGMFSNSILVVQFIKIGMPYVAATQPINSFAFVFDGIYYGSSDFAYSAYSLILASIVSIGSLFLLYESNGFVGIWIGLTINMSLRMLAGVWRMGTGTGPWRFLRSHPMSV
ncbi:putative multi antimicrobial extrusion protein [Lupinus albus]|uniref:Protein DETOXIFICATION n=1 Tax=Lupinus albus TaxID=3870 RepID=Q3T7F5_LUPAL|nr:multi drug and toxin extrusion protein [Lupinus albus]AAW30733.1 multi drug and toxin extrusion protein [Lupinus albus]KAE9584877.1 putative multi antimicrobial extrusion protein [Lupinus albus]